MIFVLLVVVGGRERRRERLLLFFLPFSLAFFLSFFFLSLFFSTLRSPAFKPRVNDAALSFFRFVFVTSRGFSSNGFLQIQSQKERRNSLSFSLFLSFFFKPSSRGAGGLLLHLLKRAQQEQQQHRWTPRSSPAPGPRQGSGTRAAAPSRKRRARPTRPASRCCRAAGPRPWAWPARCRRRR